MTSSLPGGGKRFPPLTLNKDRIRIRAIASRPRSSLCQRILAARRIETDDGSKDVLPHFAAFNTRPRCQVLPLSRQRLRVTRGIGLSWQFVMLDSTTARACEHAGRARGGSRAAPCGVDGEESVNAQSIHPDFPFQPARRTAPRTCDKSGIVDSWLNASCWVVCACSPCVLPSLSPSDTHHCVGLLCGCWMKTCLLRRLMGRWG